MEPNTMNNRPPDPFTARLMAEKERVDPSLTQIHQVIQEEIERRSGFREPEYIEVDIPKPMKLMKKVVVPFHRNPGFNYVGKLMGPGGATLKKLQEKNNVKMQVCGRGSSKDKSKEQELLLTGDPKYNHFAENLHVRIDVLAPPVEAFLRMSNALEDIRAHFNPDLNDEISKAQIAELGFNPKPSNPPQYQSNRGGRSMMRGSGGPQQRGRGSMQSNQRGRGFMANRGSGMPVNRGAMMAPQRPPLSGPQIDYPNADFISNSEFNGPSSGFYDNAPQGPQYNQQSAASAPLPPNPQSQFRGAAPRQPYPSVRGGAIMQPQSMGLMGNRPQGPGGPRMPIGQNGVGQNPMGGGKMGNGGGPMRGNFRMHPYGHPGGGPNGTAPNNASNSFA